MVSPTHAGNPARTCNWDRASEEARIEAQQIQESQAKLSGEAAPIDIGHHPVYGWFVIETTLGTILWAERGE